MYNTCFSIVNKFPYRINYHPFWFIPFTNQSATLQKNVIFDNSQKNVPLHCTLKKAVGVDSFLENIIRKQAENIYFYQFQKMPKNTENIFLTNRCSICQCTIQRICISYLALLERLFHQFSYLTRKARTIISQIRRKITTFLQYGWRFITLTTDKVVSYRILPFSNHITKKDYKKNNIDSNNDCITLSFYSVLPIHKCDLQ